MTAHNRDAGPPCPPEPDADAVSLREALIALDNLTRLSGHLWHHVDIPLHLVDAMRCDLTHLGLHLRRAAGLTPSAPRRHRPPR